MARMNDERSTDTPVRWPWTALFPLLFGLALLVFLTAIERENWFHIKPASGTAAAMGYAAGNPGGK